MEQKTSTAYREQNKKSQKLIFAGVFIAIYFVIFLVIGSICMPIPPLYLLMMPIITFICAPVFMMLVTKAPMRGPIFIAAMLPGIFLFAMGNIWNILLTCAVCGIIAEVIAYAGRYQKFGANMLSYAVFSLNLLGGFLPIWIMRDYYFADTLARGMSQEFVTTLEAMTPGWVLVVMVVLTIVCAVLGSLMSRKLFKKHFEKAGIV